MEGRLRLLIAGDQEERPRRDEKNRLGQRLRRAGKAQRAELLTLAYLVSEPLLFPFAGLEEKHPEPSLRRSAC